MPYETIKVETVDPHVTLVTLNRPDKANALNRRVFEELDQATKEIERNAETRVVLLTGAPRPDGRPWFTSGADLKPGDMGPTPHWLANEVVNRIDSMVKPVIAVVDGFCTTGGMELILACDMRLATETTQFSDWHLKNTGAGIGGWGAATRLTRLVGLAKAKEILLTGLPIDGREALHIGLINRAYPSSDRLMDGAREIARAIAGMRPDGVKLTMGFLEGQIDMDLHQALHYAEIIPNVMGIQRRFTDMDKRFDQRQQDRRG